MRLTSKPTRRGATQPLLVELFESADGADDRSYDVYPFRYRVDRHGRVTIYSVYHTLSQDEIVRLREATARVSEDLDPRTVEPLSLERLVGVLTQLAAIRIGVSKDRVGPLSELVAYEAMGLSRILALARDIRVTEFFVDSHASPLYIDHSVFGRCETSILLTDRERGAIQTHSDTFGGYTPDYGTPSLKNDLQVGGARLRISLDLEPVAVNGFALDVRRLNISTMTLNDLIRLGVLSVDAASLLVGWLESGGNVTIIGETSTGKTTLLNAIDEELEPKLRRLYIEDAVETLDLVGRGYHQVKVKVDPFDRGSGRGRTKESEIVKALHRSPDIVILSEIQSKEHSDAFFHSLAAGAKGMQTFHASSIEQALRRWVKVQGIEDDCLLDLGLMVQMTRPDRLLPERYVARISQLAPGTRPLGVTDLFVRDGEPGLRRLRDDSALRPPLGVDLSILKGRISEALEKLRGAQR